MTNYQKELQALKPWDEVQDVYKYEKDCGYDYIMTAGHGYLVVPKGDKYYQKALSIAEYGFKGKLAVYLEEDCEAGEFLAYVKSQEKEELIYSLLLNLIAMNGIDEDYQTDKEKDFLRGEYQKYQDYSLLKLQNMMLINC